MLEGTATPLTRVHGPWVPILSKCSPAPHFKTKLSLLVSDILLWSWYHFNKVKYFILRLLGISFIFCIHSKKKSTSEYLFWCFRLSQIEDSIQYMEGPNSTWKDHDRNLGVQIAALLLAHFLEFLAVSHEKFGCDGSDVLLKCRVLLYTMQYAGFVHLASYGCCAQHYHDAPSVV